MKDESNDPAARTVWLTRSEAARYVGVSGESAIRAAEDRGLEAVTDSSGRAWLSPAALDAWKWRTKLPTAAKRTAVLRQAERTREREAVERQRQADAEAEREQADWDAQRRGYDAEDALRARVRQKANEQRAAFELAHMDERTAGTALGFPPHEARFRVRDLVRRGLLRRVESPTEPRVELSMDGAREVQSSWPLCHGGPFVPREDVVSLRQETIDFSSEQLTRAPAEVREHARAMQPEEIIAEVLRVLLDRIKPQP
jgi:hypothetical protein